MKNLVILLGRLGSDPEVRYTPAGMCIANFSLATTEYKTDKDGNRQEGLLQTSWRAILRLFLRTL